MSGSSSEFVPVRRDVLADLQAAAASAASAGVGRVGQVVVTEAQAIPSTVKATVAPLGVGAVLALIATMKDVQNNETVKEHWWLLPAAVLLVGYILRRKNSPHASAVLAAGAVLFVQAWRNVPPKKKEGQAAPAPAPSSPVKPAGDTAGIPIMHPIDDRTAWIQSGGQWVRVQLGAPVRPALPAPAQSAAPANTNQDAAAQLAAAAFAT